MRLSDRRVEARAAGTEVRRGARRVARSDARGKKEPLAADWRVNTKKAGKKYFGGSEGAGEQKNHFGGSKKKFWRQREQNPQKG